MTCNLIEDDEDGPAPTAKGIWLLLLREGGRWKVSELVTFFACESSDDICKFVNVMTQRGYLSRHVDKSGARSKCEYAVTPNCKIPRGVEMRELMELGAVA